MGRLTDSERHARREQARRAARRRRRVAAASLLGLALVGAGAVVALSAGGGAMPGERAPEAGAETTASGTSARAASGSARTSAPPRALIAIDTIPPAQPGTAEVVQSGPAAERRVALTFDDGYCGDCIATLVRGLERTGAHATFFPNGSYDAEWRPHARAIRRLVARGQLIVGNHTFSHVNSPAVGSAAFAADLDRNEQWIEQTFGLTGRPYLRPPYGAYDGGTLAAAGAAGYTRVVMWNGTVADSNLRSKAYILNAIRHWARPGAIILLHANYPPTAAALPEILAILRRKRLSTATLEELIGGSPYRAAR